MMENNNKGIIKVILNPSSGRGHGAKNEKLIRQALTAANISFDLEKTQSAGHAIELARQARLDGYSIVVAAGGDGTVSEIVNGLAQATPLEECVGILAILPLGSGNDFASALGYSRNIHQIPSAIAYITAGPIVDNIFEPLVAGDGIFATSIGQIISIGPGRGIRLLFMLMGISHILVTVAAYTYRHLRLVDSELPDSI